MKNTIVIIFIMLIGFPIAQAQSLNIPLITVNGTETSYVQVDEIHFRLSIQSHAKEIKDARDKNRDIATTVFNYLAEKKIPKQYIQTKRMQISRHYINNRHPIVYDGFNAFQEIYVCLKNLNDYDEILDALLLMDIHSVSGPDFKSSKYEEAMNAAKLMALKKARVSAQSMAHALGQKIGKAKLIKNSQTRNNNNAYNNQSSTTSDFQSQSSSFEVGEIAIVASVEVSFELLD